VAARGCRTVGRARNRRRRLSTSRRSQPTISELLELPDAAAAVRAADAAPRIADTATVLANSAPDARDERAPWFLAPCDLAAIKAAGVTFVSSMLERVIEEQARGDPAKAESVRAASSRSSATISRGCSRARRKPCALKDALIAQGVWSQYLEVGIGPDAEIFTKSQPMSCGGRRRRHRHSPRIAVEQSRARGGARRQQPWGNRRRDARQRRQSARFRGRSALLLGKAKDNNASVRSDPSSGCSTNTSGSTTCAAAISRCASTVRMDSFSMAQARCR
jgi:fumarylacetoacetate (FAA) hydrolase family protein